jgi:hypothetical protein
VELKQVHAGFRRGNLREKLIDEGADISENLIKL